MPANSLRLALSLAAVIALASCGGGTSQIEPFAASRYIALGDEMSAFTADGLKYTTNGLNTDKTAVDCNVNPLWIQTVALVYGFGFAQCPVGTGDQKGLTRAALGAKASDLVIQVDAQVAAGGFTDLDLVTVLVGMNDVVELFDRYPAEDADDLKAIARQRGVVIAKQVNRMVNLGAKVIVSTVPDIGVTPYGVAKGSAGAKLLAQLSDEMNGRIRANILNDGRFVGLVLADELTQAAVRSPSSYGFVNATTPACASALPNCTTATLVTDASAETWVWADNLRMATGLHRRLGALAESRARTNPF